MSGAPLDENKTAKRFRFSLRTIFWWQLLLVPLYLAPIYAQFNPNRNVWFRLMAMLLAPVCYSALLTWWSSNDLARKRRPVLAAVCLGALYGALFGLLARSLLFVPQFIEPLAQLGDLRFAYVRANPWGLVQSTFSEMGRGLIIFLFPPVLYGVLGAATGGVLGLGQDLFRSRGKLNPEP